MQNNIKEERKEKDYFGFILIFCLKKEHEFYQLAIILIVNNINLSKNGGSFVG